MTSAPASAADTVVLQNDFESSTTPWGPRGSVTLAATATEAHAGSKSLLVSGRTGDWNGPATNAVTLFTAGTQYSVSAWVKLPAGTTGTTNMHFTVDAPGASNPFEWIGGALPVTADSWVQLSGTYTRAAAANPATLYIEAAAIGGVHPDFLVDDVLVTTSADPDPDPEPSPTVLSSDFQTTYVPWVNRGGATIALTDQGHESSSSLLVTGRTANWEGVETDVVALLEGGTEYAISGWVKLDAGEAADQLKFTVAEQSANPDAYVQVNTPVAVTDAEWVQLSGTYTPPAGLTAAKLYVEAAGNTTRYLVDDVLITGGDEVPDLGLSNDFEDVLAPWGPRGDGTATAGITTSQAHGGTQSALVSNRTQNWNGLGANVTGIFQTGHTYTISAAVRLADGATTDPSDVRLSVQRDNSGTSSYDTVTTIEDVTSAAWTTFTTDLTMASAESALLYFETVNGTSDFLVDDIVVTAASAPDVQLDIPSLKDELPWPVGVAIDERETLGSGATLVTKHFDQLTPENYMKPESIQPTEGTFTFDAADQLVDFAVANDLRVYGHTLVWHSQTPAWFFQDENGDPLTTSDEDKALLRQRMQTHIEAVADHFRTKYGEYGTPGNPIVGFDVVNEAIAESESDGLRRSEWYRILGPSYLNLAFDYASDAFNGGVVDGPVKLFINDYNTEFPAKRQAMFDVVQGLLDDGAPIDGVGHQFHLSLGGPVAQMKASIDKFAELGLLQDVSELDVQIDGTVTADKLVEQGYYYKQIFDMLREYPNLFSVTVWGPYDSRSWRTGAPLLFDDDLQAKPAYWGIVDADELPTLTRSTDAHEADIEIGEHAFENWERLPLVPIVTTGDGVTGFQTRWTDDGLIVYVDVIDGTDDGADDSVSVFVGDEKFTARRNGNKTGTGDGVVESTADGYRIVAKLPLTDAEEGDVVPFDLRITDDAGSQVSWNDLTHGQEDGERLGNVNLIEPLGFVEIPEAAAAPTIDGTIDSAWANAPVVETDRQVEGAPGATADVRTLWSGDKVYVLFEVTDSQLNDANSNAWEQDSVEIFVDPGNAKAGAYRENDGQYRVNFNNVQSISGDLSVIGSRLTSATATVSGGYIVEASIDLGDAIESGDFAGLEFQVNDATDGARTSVRNWADPTGRSYQTTWRWGVGQFVDAPPTLQFTTVPKPTIVGTARVGSTLSVASGTWVPTATSYAYEWRVGGVVAGTGSTYVPVAADLGKTITVTLTGSRDDYIDATSPVSKATAKVVSGVLTTATPTITGVKAVGYTLTAVPGAWGPDGVVLAYQWLREGKSISGATGASYELTGSDYKKRISVKVTGTKAGYTTASKTSSSTSTIAAGALSHTEVPTISGTAKVGSTLTAVSGAWQPAPVTLSYQWLVNGASVKNATKSTFTIPASAQGGLVEVRVTGSKTGYAKVVRVSEAVSVERGEFVTATPTISGTVKVGAKVTAVRGAWSPTSGATFRYQWYWQTAADAPLNPIVGATSSSYTIPSSLFGQLLLVKVTAVKAGYTTAAELSAPTAAVLGKLTVKTPKVTGTAKVGNTLTAVPGTWGPSGVVLSYQWVRVSGSTVTPIGSATDPTYQLTAADKGKTIRVQVTGTLSGYATQTVSSASTKKVG